MKNTLLNTILKLYAWWYCISFWDEKLSTCDCNLACYLAHLKRVRQTISDGADIIGYLHWFLIDNYE
jgi:hypothetical protein